MNIDKFREDIANSKSKRNKNINDKIESLIKGKTVVKTTYEHFPFTVQIIFEDDNTLRIEQKDYEDSHIVIYFNGVEIEE